MNPKINKPLGWEVLVSFFLLVDYGLFFGIKGWFFALTCGILSGLVDAYVLTACVDRVILLRNPRQGYWGRGFLTRIPFLALLVYFFIVLCKANLLWFGLGLGAGFVLGVTRGIQCRQVMHKVRLCQQFLKA